MKESNSPPEFASILRVLGGGYLVYLAWDLRSAIGDSPLYLIAVLIFAAVGLALLVTSIRYLVNHRYFRKSEIEAEYSESEDELMEDCEERSDD